MSGHKRRMRATGIVSVRISFDHNEPLLILLNPPPPPHPVSQPPLFHLPSATFCWHTYLQLALSQHCSAELLRIHNSLLLRRLQQLLVALPVIKASPTVSVTLCVHMKMFSLA